MEECPFCSMNGDFDTVETVMTESGLEHTCILCGWFLEELDEEE